MIQAIERRKKPGIIARIQRRWYLFKLSYRCFRTGHYYIGSNEGTFCIKCGIDGDILDCKEFWVVRPIETLDFLKDEAKENDALDS